MRGGARAAWARACCIGLAANCKRLPEYKEAGWCRQFVSAWDKPEDKKGAGEVGGWTLGKPLGVAAGCRVEVAARGGVPVGSDRGGEPAAFQSILPCGAVWCCAGQPANRQRYERVTLPSMFYRCCARTACPAACRVRTVLTCKSSPRDWQFPIWNGAYWPAAFDVQLPFALLLRGVNHYRMDAEVLPAGPGTQHVVKQAGPRRFGPTSGKVRSHRGMFALQKNGTRSI
jgi:hypothetical protein